MEIPLRELQHCNTATASAEPNCLFLNMVGHKEKKMKKISIKIKNNYKNIREPQWKCCTFAVSKRKGDGNPKAKGRKRTIHR